MSIGVGEVRHDEALHHSHDRRDGEEARTRAKKEVARFNTGDGEDDPKRIPLKITNTPPLF